MAETADYGSRVSPPAPLFGPPKLRQATFRITFAVGLAFALVALRIIIGLQLGPWIAASLATACMITWLAALALRKPIEARGIAFGRIASLGAVLGVATVPVAYFAAFVIEEATPAALFMLPVAVMLGLPVGIFVGWIFGLLAAPPLSLAARAIGYPSAHASDRAVLWLGVWTLVIAMVLVSVPPIVQPIYGYFGPSTELIPGYVAAQYLGATGLFGLGTVLVGLAARRLAARRNFIDRVAMELEPGWFLAEADDEKRPVGLPCLDRSAEDCSVLLCQTDQTGQGAYRRTDASRPVAWVPPRWVQLDDAA